MATLIIDDFGDVFRSGSPDLIRRLGYTVGGPSVENYAIENMGFVGIAEHGGKIHVRCRPALMADKTISSLLYWMFDRGNVVIVVSWLEDVWRLERAMPCRIAATFLTQLMEKRTQQPMAANPRLLSRLSDGVAHRWSKIAATTIQATDARISTATRARALDHIFNGRWTIVELDLRSFSLSTVDLGDGYPPLDPGLMRGQGGFNLAGAGDRHYKEWVRENFIDVARTDQPKFEDVDAVISWPRIGDARTRYWRAVVPLDRDEASCRLLSASGCDSSIDLRPNLVQVNG